MTQITRRATLQILSALGIGSVAFHKALAVQIEESQSITAAMIANASWIAEQELTPEQQEEVAKTVASKLRNISKLRQYAIDADTPLSVSFVPHFFADAKRSVADLPELDVQFSWREFSSAESPTLTESEISFASVRTLGQMLRSRQVSSFELTKLYLSRLNRFNPLLNCVVNLTEEIALAQAKRADDELATGSDRGPLHGIPYGAKDIMTVPNLPTTWGVSEYRDTVRQQTATVVQRMESAGAVLLGKLSVGTMAWGDEWFGGMTRNPWNPEQGSSGSSAGSACAVAAGMCGFALGTETHGSIVSPSRRCGVTGLRPTFGRISRAGCMTLGWTLDKIGPIVRYVEDAAAVFANLLGADGRDPTVVHRPFHWPAHQSTNSWKIGFIPDQLSKAEQECLERLRAQGAAVVEIALPTEVPIDPLMDCLSCEAATMHEELSRNAADEQVLGKWGPTFRGGQWIPAVHYLRGLRARTQLISLMEATLSKVDVLLGGQDLAHTNLSGHPSLVVAVSSRETPVGPQPDTIKLTSRLFAEDVLLSVGQFLQMEIPPTPAAPPLERFLQESE
ncbi:MAG: amidase [Planctomycetales bacterium]|nr:amidase [Planctomycetales bacterium]